MGGNMGAAPVASSSLSKPISLPSASSTAFWPAFTLRTFAPRR